MVGCKPVAGCSRCHRVQACMPCVGCCMLLQHGSCAAGCCCCCSTGRGETWRLVPKAVWYWCIHFTCTNEEAVGRPAGRVWQRASAVAPAVCGFHSSRGITVVCYGFRVVLLKLHVLHKAEVWLHKACNCLFRTLSFCVRLKGCAALTAVACPRTVWQCSSGMALQQ